MTSYWTEILSTGLFVLALFCDAYNRQSPCKLFLPALIISFTGVSRVRPHKGQAMVCRRLRALLNNKLFHSELAGKQTWSWPVKVTIWTIPCCSGSSFYTFCARHLFLGRHPLVLDIEKLFRIWGAGTNKPDNLRLPKLYTIWNAYSSVGLPVRFAPMRLNVICIYSDQQLLNQMSEEMALCLTYSQ